METLFGTDVVQADPQLMRKKDYAERIGVHPSRVSQLIAAGLPVEPSGLIRVSSADPWIARHLDPSRRRIRFPGEAASPAEPEAASDRPAAPVPPAPATRGAQPAVPTSGAAAKDELVVVRLERERLELEARRGALVDRKAVEAAIFARSRRERNAHASFALQAAPIIAARIGCAAEDLQRELVALMRDHLDRLASAPLEDLDDDA